MKTSQIPFMPQRAPEPFGLVAIIESKRVILPLKGVECDFSVVSGVGEVSMTQVFRQDNKQALDCEYQFPLPADASVYSCEADINGRTIRAEVKEQQEARRIAAEKKAAGFRTALVEAERENLFTLSLGNVQPGDLVIIELKYFQTLRSLAGRPSIEIPFCPGVRYIPGAPLVRSNKGKGIIDDTDQVPDASRITPVRIDAEHPDAAYIEVRGTLDGKFVDEKEITSPSHSIAVQKTGEQLRVSLADKGEVPDHDFVLRWSETAVDSVASRAWVREKGKAQYALLEIRAPKAAQTERAPVDFYFLVDRSGSMQGEKWNKAADALQSCVKVLGPADRAMVTFFESGYQDFAEGPIGVQELLNDRQFQNVKKLGTAGGTELGPALTHALEVAAKHSAGRCKNLILITDAQVGNESAILKLMKAAPDLPLHCFGIDVALNDSLLLALCRQQGGTFHSLNPNDDIEKAVTALGKTLGQPVLLELELSEGWEPAEAMIPNLYAGQVHYLSARSSSGKPLKLGARNAASQPVAIEFERQAATFDAPYLHWCRSRIQRLVMEDAARKAIALSIESNLICPLTAFIAWDESEKVPIATQELVQPGLEGLQNRLCSPQLGMAHRLTERLGFVAPSVTRGSSAAGLFREFPGGQAVTPLRGSVGADELVLRRELSEICHRTGISGWRALVKALFRWIAAASGPRRQVRIDCLKALVGEIKVQAAKFDRAEESRQQKGMNEARATIHQLMKEFLEKLQAKN